MKRYLILILLVSFALSPIQAADDRPSFILDARRIIISQKIEGKIVSIESEFQPQEFTTADTWTYPRKFRVSNIPQYQLPLKKPRITDSSGRIVTSLDQFSDPSDVCGQLSRDRIRIPDGLIASVCRGNGPVPTIIHSIIDADPTPVHVDVHNFNLSTFNQPLVGIHRPIYESPKPVHQPEPNRSSQYHRKVDSTAATFALTASTLADLNRSDLQLFGRIRLPFEYSSTNEPFVRTVVPAYMNSVHVGSTQLHAETTSYKPTHLGISQQRIEGLIVTPQIRLIDHSPVMPTVTGCGTTSPSR